ncbi:MAG: DUF59 domain-containing protein, partial [Chitinophagaceae bacterium]
MVTTDNILKQEIWSMLEDIPDPEIPVISIVDLGIVRDVVLDNENIDIRIVSGHTSYMMLPQIRYGNKT